MIGDCSSLVRLASLSGVVLALAGSGTYAATTHDSASSKQSAVSTDVCLSTDEAANVDAKLVTLERDLKVARAKARKLGGVLGCGVGVGWQIDNGSTTVDSVPFCGVVFGWRF